MPRKPALKLTRFELEVMEVIWQLGRASVRDVLERLPESRRAAYTTVQTIVHRLEQKTALRRVTTEGKAHVFEACFAREGAYRRLLDDFLALFGGSARPLTSYLVESGRLTLADLREMERGVEKLARDRKRQGG